MADFSLMVTYRADDQGEALEFASILESFLRAMIPARTVGATVAGVYQAQQIGEAS